MNAIEPRHSAAEFKEWGDRIYNEKIRPRLSEKDHGKFIAIDIEGRGYELADSPTPASDTLYERIPDAQIWLKRVGYPAAFQFRSPRHTKPIDGAERRHSISPKA